MTKIKFLPLFLLPVFVTGCIFSSDNNSGIRPQKVRVVSVAPAGTTSGETYTGTVKGRYETNLAFQTGGQIISRKVEVGQQVEAGELLMTLNPQDALQQAAQGDAQLESARSQLNLAEANLARYETLYAESAVSAAVRDQYRMNYETALAAYNSALASSRSGHNVLGYTNLVASSTGVISSITAEQGQVIAAGQTVMTLVRSGEREVEIQVPEQERTRLAEGTPVNVSFWALAGNTAGVVREISPIADKVLRTYRVRISLIAPPEDLALGMTASAVIASDSVASPKETETVQTYRLPLTAIYETTNRPQVWVVKDGTVTLVPVDVIKFIDNDVLVTDLNPGDQVVTAGVHKLIEGAPVEVLAEGQGIL